MSHAEFQSPDRRSGPDRHPSRIAEMSGQHAPPLARAPAVIDADAAARADAMQLQTGIVQPRKRQVNAPGFNVVHGANNRWVDRHLHDLEKQDCPSWDGHATITTQVARRGPATVGRTISAGIASGPHQPRTAGPGSGLALKIRAVVPAQRTQQNLPASTALAWEHLG